MGRGPVNPSLWLSQQESSRFDAKPHGKKGKGRWAGGQGWQWPFCLHALAVQPWFSSLPCTARHQMVAQMTAIFPHPQFQNFKPVLTLLCPLPHPSRPADRQHSELELANPTEVISLCLSKGVLGFGTFFSKERKGSAHSPEHRGACERPSESQANQAKRCKTSLGERATNPGPSSAHQPSCTVHTLQPQKLILLWIHPPATFSCCRTLCFSVGTAAQHSTNPL